MKKNSNRTLDYYNSHASDFAEGTRHVDFSPLQNEFISRIRQGGNVLDLGCGSGRDSKAFLACGFQVTAVDGSRELCDLASAYIGQEVICADFREYEPAETFDGIWACASLLHLAKEDILPVIGKLAEHLSDDGCFYLSFKYGDFSGERNGRYFTDMTEETFGDLIRKIPSVEISDQFVTADARPDRSEEKWLNVFLKKSK